MIRPEVRLTFPALHRPSGGVRIVESPNATTMPTAQPHTDDMREMVERIGRVPVPAAFRMGGVLFVHPVIFARLRANSEVL